MKLSIENQKNFDKLSNALATINFNVALVHSDLFQGFRFDYRLGREDMILSHYTVLKELMDNKPLWMPTFNYSFPVSGEYNLQSTKSKVGALTEYFRTNIATWQSKVPVFSFAGEQDKPLICEDNIIDAFGINSVFDHLVKKNGLILFYGTGLLHATIIHYCEQLSGMLTYRYDKFFEGKVINGDSTTNIKLKFHVRPKGKTLNYNFMNLEKDLYEQGLLQRFTPSFNSCLIKANHFVEFVIDKMKQDPLYLLDDESRNWIEPELEKLGRPFLLSDFE
jgi:aminoglycoside 3-N-acetyltransferase